VLRVCLLLVELRRQRVRRARRDLRGLGLPRDLLVLVPQLPLPDLPMQPRRRGIKRLREILKVVEGHELVRRDEAALISIDQINRLLRVLHHHVPVLHRRVRRCEKRPLFEQFMPKKRHHFAKTGSGQT
jgi:hypothetical protein